MYKPSLVQVYFGSAREHHPGPLCRPICPARRLRSSCEGSHHMTSSATNTAYACTCCSSSVRSTEPDQNMAGMHAHCHVRAKAADRTRHRVNTPFGLLGRHKVPADIRRRVCGLRGRVMEARCTRYHHHHHHICMHHIALISIIIQYLHHFKRL